MSPVSLYCGLVVRQSKANNNHTLAITSIRHDYLLIIHSKCRSNVTHFKSPWAGQLVRTRFWIILVIGVPWILLVHSFQSHSRALVPVPSCPNKAKAKSRNLPTVILEFVHNLSRRMMSSYLGVGPAKRCIQRDAESENPCIEVSLPSSDHGAQVLVLLRSCGCGASTFLRQEEILRK